MFLKFLGPTDLESWALDYRLKVTATDDGLVVKGISGHICQHTDDLLAVTDSVDCGETWDTPRAGRLGGNELLGILQFGRSHLEEAA